MEDEGLSSPAARDLMAPMITSGSPRGTNACHAEDGRQGVPNVELAVGTTFDVISRELPFHLPNARASSRLHVLKHADGEVLGIAHRPQRVAAVLERDQD